MNRCPVCDTAMLAHEAEVVDRALSGFVYNDQFEAIAEHLRRDERLRAGIPHVPCRRCLVDIMAELV